VLLIVYLSKTKYHFPAGHNRLQSLLASVQFLKDPIGIITRNMQKFSGTYSGFLAGRGKFIITQDPDFVQYVLRDNHTNYQKSELSTKTAAGLFGNGLLFSNGEAWLKQRRLIQPAFHQHKIQGLHEIIVKTASEYISGIPGGRHTDIYHLMHTLSFSVLIHSLFDIELSPGTITELSQGFTDLQDFLLKDIHQPYRKILYPFNGKNALAGKKSERIRKIIEEIIDQRKSGGGSHQDLLDMMLNAVHEDTGKGMEAGQLIDEIQVLLFAGHETTANSLSWILYLLASHPAVEKKLRNAVEKTNIYDSPRDEYIQAVISEGMRLYPAAWMTERVAIKDDQYQEYSYPGGTIIIPFFYGMHRNKKFWKEEMVFDPERFMFHDPILRKRVKGFFPFGAGPRMCIGNNFALTEMAIILHLFLTTFEITPTAEVPVMWPLITLRPRKLYLNINRVQKS
jgi:cytochrome P450